MRAIPDSMDTTVVAAIDERLDGVESDHGITILWAVESGSRAWGFPSPDSDYDGRFLYIRPVEDYLSLNARRDVIETPLDQIFDVNGWDVRKALSLMVRGNATVGEWLRSPIVYRGDEAFRDGMLALAGDVVDPFELTQHHVHVARNNQALLERTGALKKFFYVLRHATTLRWMRVRGGVVPPIALGDLLDEAEVSDVVQQAATQLIAEKARTREMGAGEVPDVLRTFVEEELTIAIDRLPRLESGRGERDAAWERADAVFLDRLELAAHQGRRGTTDNG